jgi:hypothetical protein
VLDVLKHPRACVVILSVTVLAMLIWASYEGLRPRVTNWMTPMEAIQAFAPANLGASFVEYSRRLSDLEHANETLYLEIYGKPDSPELESIKHRKHDVEGQILILKATLSTNYQTATRMIYQLLYSGKLLAAAYDVDTDQFMIIPIEYWQSIELLGEQLSEAGGIGFHHYRNLLVGENPCYSVATRVQAVHCTLPLATP